MRNGAGLLYEIAGARKPAYRFPHKAHRDGRKKFGKSLDRAKIADRPNFVFEKSLSYQRRKTRRPNLFQIFPKLSLAVLSDSNGLDAKKLGKAFYAVAKVLACRSNH
jgi:hypothetical protein